MREQTRQVLECWAHRFCIRRIQRVRAGREVTFGVGDRRDFDDGAAGVSYFSLDIRIHPLRHNRANPILFSF